jgi:hypothetical protein
MIEVKAKLPIPMFFPLSLLGAQVHFRLFSFYSVALPIFLQNALHGATL